ncbi:hypothetical protein CUR83_03340 [Psychrobacter pocilloporae]|uniref:Uncharacterized protein n=1 Tax=Psychrobacter pocilloporae TaxID=1775882 RepID=A0ABT6IQK6_9GAMM|nr:hypothetical protein [Psychrobacter pocilloporae]
MALDLSNSRRECKQGVTDYFYIMLNLNDELPTLSNMSRNQDKRRPPNFLSIQAQKVEEAGLLEIF